MVNRDVKLQRVLCGLILCSGFATLSWELIWQVKSTLALGISAMGTAITLAVTMGGMCVGGAVMGRLLRSRTVRAVRIYAGLEVLIGVSGLLLGVAFEGLAELDRAVYGSAPGAAWLVHAVGIIVVLGIPAMGMGATFPVFGLMGRQFGVSIATLYSLNTLGAAVGVLFAALVLIPAVGISGCIGIIAGLNMLVAGVAWLLPAGRVAAEEVEQQDGPVSRRDLAVVFITGLATFMLEIAWFRSLAITFPNTTDVFAIMLACVLIALALAAKNVARLKQKGASLGRQLCLAGLFILVVTPMLEQLNFVLMYSQQRLAQVLEVGPVLDAEHLTVNGVAVMLYAAQVLVMFLITFCMIVPPMQCLGVAFPWIVEEQRSSRRLGNLYAVNTFSAIVGALGTAWLLLPTIGFAQAAWLAGILVGVTGVWLIPKPKRLVWAAALVPALAVAVWGETGVVRGQMHGHEKARILESFNGPESTVTVVEYDEGTRRLFIDSSSASGESGKVFDLGVHYMAWMGHLPMLLHAEPKDAMVICFGTGQTSHAVRSEGVTSLDIVDVNGNIFKLAKHFRSNKEVLKDPRVTAIVMDGRAYMRRATKMYDVITLEPMPPNNAGVNNLYSKEFYELARGRLNEGGVIAQWLPFHEVSPHSAASIARTFASVFPNAVLWLDPVSKSDGILLGIKEDAGTLSTAWPGFARSKISRNLSQEDVLKGVALDREQLRQYSAFGDVISDDNQLLAYGRALYYNMGLVKEDFEMMQRVNPKIEVPK